MSQFYSIERKSNQKGVKGTEGTRERDLQEENIVNVKRGKRDILDHLGRYQLVDVPLIGWSPFSIQRLRRCDLPLRE